MASSTQIKSLLQSHGTGDDERFYVVALQVAAAEARQGHEKLAKEIRELVEQARRRAAERKLGTNVLSVSGPRGEVADLLESVHNDISVRDLILAAPLQDRIERVLREQQNLSRLKENVPAWWEMWVRRADGPWEDRFHSECGRLGIKVPDQRLVLPDHVIFIASADRSQLEASLDLLNTLAEIRMPRPCSVGLTDLTSTEQHEWIAEALDRIEWPGKDAPAVCLMDTGVNRGHPLIEPLLAAGERTVDERHVRDACSCSFQVEKSVRYSRQQGGHSLPCRHPHPLGWAGIVL